MILSNCDMHIHTTCSDGELTPEQLVDLAHKNGVEYLSITDHDVVDFYFNKNAIDLLKKDKIKFITGCEFVCNVDGNPIEILGYGINVEKAKKYLGKHGVTQEKITAIRIKRIPKVFKKLGFKVDFSKQSIKENGVLNNLFMQVKANEKISKKLSDENPALLESYDKLFRLGLNNAKSIAFINASKYYPSYKKIINLIQNKLNGIAILAHPYQYGEAMEYVLNKVANAGIDGIECYHYSGKNISQQKHLIDFATKHKLLISGGSDFHRMIDIQNKPNSRDKVSVPEQVFKNLNERINKKHNKNIG